MQRLARVQTQDLSGRLYGHAEDVITTPAALTFIASVYHIQRINEVVESDRNSAKISINQNDDLMYATPCRLDHLNTATLQAKVNCQGSSNRNKGGDGARLISRREFGRGEARGSAKRFWRVDLSPIRQEQAFR